MILNNSFKIVNALGSEYGVDYKSDSEINAVPLFQNYPKALLSFAYVCSVLFVLIGIPGNLTTIIALAKCRKVRNATAIFIINLQICDLIFCCTVLPLIAATFWHRHWIYGIAICRTFALFKFALNAVSIFTTCAIAINRYVMVCHPLIYPKLYKRRNLSIMVITLWISGFAIFLPSIFGVWGKYNLEPNSGFCTMLKDDHHRSPKKIFLAVAFVGPYLTMTLCYARIWWVVRKTAKNARKNYKPPKKLPEPATKTLNGGITLVSFQEPVTTALEEEVSSSPASSPVETDKTLQKYFKAPFRLTRKEIRPKLPTRRDKKLCTMIVAIMLTFCISHVPVMTIRMIYKTYKTQPSANIFAHLLEYSGSCINPVIYVLMSHEYRQAYKSLFDNVRKRFQKGQVIYL